MGKISIIKNGSYNVDIYWDIFIDKFVRENPKGHSNRIRFWECRKNRSRLKFKRILIRRKGFNRTLGTRQDCLF